jgi:LacI family transcriptional regulator
MEKQRATIHDIARSLNVTASTVSRALNDSSRISDVTKKAVQKAARDLNYQPNHIAAALRNGKSNIIGIIVPTVDRASFSSVVRGIEEIANKSRYNVMIAQTYDDYNKEVETVDALLNARVDGIIASHAKSTTDFSHFLKVKNRGIPLVLFDRTKDDLKVSQILINDYLGAYTATEHLIQQGCRRIAHFTNTLKISIYMERLRGYRDALTTNGIKYNPSLVIESNLQLEDGRASMLQLLKLSEIPDAVFSASALGIMGALQICNEKKIKVPRQMALVGFSNEPFTSFTEPSITTVEQHSMRIGNAAAQIFLKEVGLDHTRIIPQKVVLTPDLVIRASSLRKQLN